MADEGEEQHVQLTEEAMLVVELTRALYKREIDEVFRILGRHMDKQRLQVSGDVLEEFELAGRIRGCL